MTQHSLPPTGHLVFPRAGAISVAAHWSLFWWTGDSGGARIRLALVSEHPCGWTVCSLRPCPLSYYILVHIVLVLTQPGLYQLAEHICLLACSVLFFFPYGTWFLSGVNMWYKIFTFYAHSDIYVCVYIPLIHIHIYVYICISLIIYTCNQRYILYNYNNLCVCTYMHICVCDTHTHTHHSARDS